MFVSHFLFNLFEFLQKNLDGTLLQINAEFHSFFLLILKIFFIFFFFQNKPLVFEPIDFESFILKNKTLIQNDPQRELLMYPNDDVSVSKTFFF